MSYYLRVLDPKERGNITHDICSIHSTLSDAIDALSNVEKGTFVSLTTKRPRIKKCLSCDTRKAHDYLLDENIQLREALADCCCEYKNDSVPRCYARRDDPDGHCAAAKQGCLIYKLLKGGKE